METLKRIQLVIFIWIFSLSVYSQTTSYQANFYKSYEYEHNSKFTLAISVLSNMYNPNDYFINIRLGWLNYLAKNYAESIRFYSKAIALKPYAIEARFGYIKPLSAIEKWDIVKQQYLEILKIDPQNTLANYWLGVIYYNRKSFTNAVKLFEKVVNLYPLDYDSVIMLGWTKLQLGNLPEAKLLFLHALTLRPDDSSALSGLKAIK